MVRVHDFVSSGSIFDRNCYVITLGELFTHIQTHTKT